MCVSTYLISFMHDNTILCNQNLLKFQIRTMKSTRYLNLKNILCICSLQDVTEYLQNAIEDAKAEEKEGERERARARVRERERERDLLGTIH